MKTACLAILGFTLAIGSAHAAELQTFAGATWLCRSPAAYDQAIEQAQNLQGKNLRELQRQLLDDKLCMFIDADDVEDILAPFVAVTERQGDRVKVSFTLEFYKKIEYLHRRISRVTYAGWTDAGNLTNAY